MTLSDLERRDARGQIFQADLLNNARTGWPRTTKFGRLTRVERGVFLRGQTHSHRNMAGPQRSPILGVLYLSRHPLMQNDHVPQGNTSGERRVSATPPIPRTRSPSAPQILRFLLFMFTSFDVERPNSSW